jgi:hypothetical protein
VYVRTGHALYLSDFRPASLCLTRQTSAFLAALTSTRCQHSRSASLRSTGCEMALSMSTNSAERLLCVAHSATTRTTSLSFVPGPSTAGRMRWECTQIHSSSDLQGVIEAPVTKTRANLERMAEAGNPEQPPVPKVETAETETLRLCDVRPSLAQPRYSWREVIDHIAEATVTIGTNALVPRGIAARQLAPSQVVREPNRLSRVTLKLYAALGTSFSAPRFTSGLF